MSDKPSLTPEARSAFNRQVAQNASRMTDLLRQQILQIIKTCPPQNRQGAPWEAMLRAYGKLSESKAVADLLENSPVATSHMVDVAERLTTEASADLVTLTDWIDKEFCKT